MKPISLRRLAPARTVKKTILIVCEDGKSSPDYFDRLRKKLHLGTVNVKICGKECGSAPISVVGFAKEQKSEIKTSTTQDDYDEIFCVVDIDDHPRRQLQDAIQKARDNGLKLIISNPCFEYWYVLHFEKTGGSYTNRPELYKKLAILLGHKYEKSGCDFFETIYPRTKTAIDNAKAILSGQWHNEEDLSECDPSTDVFRVAECLMDLK